jgi:hypothetical protein
LEYRRAEAAIAAGAGSSGVLPAVLLLREFQLPSDGLSQLVAIASAKPDAIELILFFVGVINQVFD